MFSKVELAKKTEFLDRAKVAREERASERQRELSAIKIQARPMSVISSACFVNLKTSVIVSRALTFSVSDAVGLAAGRASGR